MHNEEDMLNFGVGLRPIPGSCYDRDSVIKALLLPAVMPPGWLPNFVSTLPVYARVASKLFHKLWTRTQAVAHEYTDTWWTRLRDTPSTSRRGRASAESTVAAPSAEHLDPSAVVLSWPADIFGGSEAESAAFASHVQKRPLVAWLDSYRQNETGPLPMSAIESRVASGAYWAGSYPHTNVEGIDDHKDFDLLGLPYWQPSAQDPRAARLSPAEILRFCLRSPSILGGHANAEALLKGVDSLVSRLGEGRLIWGLKKAVAGTHGMPTGYDLEYYSYWKDHWREHTVGALLPLLDGSAADVTPFKGIERLDALPYYLASFDMLGGHFHQPETVHVYFPARTPGAAGQITSRSFKLVSVREQAPEPEPAMRLQEENHYFCFFNFGRAPLSKHAFVAKGRALLGDGWLPAVGSLLPAGVLERLDAGCFALKKRGILGLYTNRLPLDALMGFLRFFEYEESLIGFFEEHADRLAHRLWDLSFDLVPTPGSEGPPGVRILRTSFYSTI